MAEICVALLTPFTTSGDVAFDALEMHTEFLLAEGVTSLMASGTTGVSGPHARSALVSVLTWGGGRCGR